MSVCKQLMGLDFHSKEKILWMSMRLKCLISDILQNIFFCVQQKKDIHKGLEHLEGKSITTVFNVCVNYPFKTESYMDFNSKTRSV